MTKCTSGSFAAHAATPILPESAAPERISRSSVSRHDRNLLHYARTKGRRDGAILRELAGRYSDADLETAFEEERAQCERCSAFAKVLNETRNSNLSDMGSRLRAEFTVSAGSVTFESKAMVSIEPIPAGCVQIARLGPADPEAESYVSGLLDWPHEPHVVIALGMSGFCQLPLDREHSPALRLIAAGSLVFIPSINVAARVSSRSIRSRLRARLETSGGAS